MKTLVLYYSNTGSNRYLAQRIAGALECDIEEIRPRIGAHILLILFSWLKTGPGISRLSKNPSDYEQVILVGPIWMGSLIAPLRSTLNRYGAQFKQLYFATCCGSHDAVKDDKFGYNTVFPKVKEIVGDRCVHCEAFPIRLVIPNDKKDDDRTIMATRLGDENFSGEIKQRFDRFVERVSGA